ncbi:MAG TPA: prepilin-type N-terminal cleavage/methylation domain-containing protein [Longimicrobiaceae bacterium]
MPERTARGAPLHTRGFTLAEVMTALVVVGIMVAIAAPRLDLTTFRVDGAMQAAGSTLLAAQRAAVVRQHDVVVAFQTDGGLIRVHEDADNDGLLDAGETVGFTELGEGVVFGRGGAPAHPVGAGPVTFARRQGGVPCVTFHRNGTASEEGGAYLTTQAAARTGSKPATARLVRVDRATGRASWFRYSGGRWEQGF